MLRRAEQRAVLRVPVVEEKEAGERRLRLARQQLSQQASQLRAALLLAGPPRHAGDLEGVRVVAQHQQLALAARAPRWRPCQSPGARRSWGRRPYAAPRRPPAGRSPTGSAEQSPRRRAPSPTPTRSRGRAGSAGTRR